MSKEHQIVFVSSKGSRRESKWELAGMRRGRQRYVEPSSNNWRPTMDQIKAAIAEADTNLVKRIAEEKAKSPPWSRAFEIIRVG